ERLAAVLRAPGRLSACHNDLLPANLLDDGRDIRIIDWEYASMGDPYFDLAALCANARLDEDAANGMLTAYLGRDPRPNESA
ncbi:phosphotransferase, partial [Klebsiella pneumoniae]|uniref:phosphotransferase n=1 Tax=Klebsiella pneumoniae TaxID=573 RepID=UPI0022704435